MDYDLKCKKINCKIVEKYIGQHFLWLEKECLGLTPKIIHKEKI